MGCSSCGQGGGYSSPSSGGMSSSGGCGGRKAMDENKPLKQIQNGDKNFCFNEIDDKACENLGKNKGIHPTKANENDSCDDLKALNDLGIASLNNRLIMLDFCNIEDLKCWLFSLLSWIWNINRAIIGTICGLWCTINKMQKAILEMAYSNVETVGSYDVLDATPELSVSVRKDGTFTYEWSDWNSSTKPWTRLRHGKLNGKIDFTMKTNDEGGLDYQIKSVHIGTIDYKTSGNGSLNTEPRYYILVPYGGTKVWERKGTVATSWSENIDKTVKFEKKGSINPKSESSYIDFMTWGADWSVDDKVKLRFKFINNNEKIDLDC